MHRCLDSLTANRLRWLYLPYKQVPGWCLLCSGVPEVADAVVAQADPGLAVLSAMAHRQDADAEKALRIAVAAAIGAARGEAKGRTELLLKLITLRFGPLRDEAGDSILTRFACAIIGMHGMKLMPSHSAIARAGIGSANNDQLRIKPSEIFRQVYATFEEEPLGPALLPLLGPDNFMWASDYPHPDSTFPHSRDAIAQAFKGLESAFVEKVTASNCARLYGFE